MDYQKYNSDVRDWTSRTLKDLRSELRKQKVKFSENSNSIKKILRTSVRNQRGIATRISFKMPQHAIFLHKGVGRGRPISRAKGAKRWFNPVIDRNISDLGDRVANGQADLVVNNINIR